MEKNKYKMIKKRSLLFRGIRETSAWLLIMGLLAGHLGHYVEAKQEFLSPIPKDYAIWTVTEVQEVIKEVPVTYSAYKCAQNHPEVAEKLKATFPDDWANAWELFCRESGFNKYAINPTSGACGLVQSLPCSKMQCDLGDLDCQIAWGKKYVESRYGTAKNAVSFHDLHNWY